MELCSYSLNVKNRNQGNKERKGISRTEGKGKQVREGMEKDASKATCREFQSSFEGNKDTKKEGRLTLILPSFFFSFQFMTMLQFIDDICAQINPMLWSLIFH